MNGEKVFSKSQLEDTPDLAHRKSAIDKDEYVEVEKVFIKKKMKEQEEF